MALALPLAVVLSLARQAAPAVAPDTIATFCEQESGRRPFAIHDNTTGDSYDPSSAPDAIRLARGLIRAGHSVDLGLLQVNFTGPTRRGLSVAEAFTPARNMAVGASILADAYRACQGRTDGAAATLRCAAALYNAGRQDAAGRRYAARIWQTAEQVVPSIGRLLTSDFPDAAPGTTPTGDTGARPSQQSCGGTASCRHATASDSTVQDQPDGRDGDAIDDTPATSTYETFFNGD